MLSGLTLKNPLEIPSNLTNYYDKNSNSLSVKALFIEIGRIFPSTSLLQNLIKSAGLKTDEAGFILVNTQCETNLPGFYAAGDCCSKTVRQLVTATSDGAIAATSALNFLS